MRTAAACATKQATKGLRRPMSGSAGASTVCVDGAQTEVQGGGCAERAVVLGTQGCVLEVGRGNVCCSLRSAHLSHLLTVPNCALPVRRARRPANLRLGPSTRPRRSPTRFRAAPAPGFSHLLLDQDNAHALPGKHGNSLQHSLYQDRRQPDAGLVEHQQFWLCHQCSADCDHLRLAAGERARELSPPLIQAREDIESASRIVARAARARRSTAPRRRLPSTHWLANNCRP